MRVADVVTVVPEKVLTTNVSVEVTVVELTMLVLVVVSGIVSVTLTN